MNEGLKLQRVVTSIILVAVAAAAGWGSTVLLARSIERAQPGLLAAGLAVAAVGVVPVGALVRLGLIAMGEAKNEASSRKRIALIVASLAALAEGGLEWLAVRFAVDGHAALAWSVGGLALALAAAAVILASFLAEGDLDYLFEAAVATVAAVACDLCLGWLAVSFAAERSAWLGWLFGILALIALCLALLLAISYGGLAADWDVPLVLIGYAAVFASVSAVAARLGLNGNTVLAWVFGGLVATPPAGYALLFLAGLFLKGQTQIGSRSLGKPPGNSVSLLARLIGLVVPLAAFGWALGHSIYHAHTAIIVSVLTVTAGVGAAVVATLLVQGLIIAWLRPGPPMTRQVRAAEDRWSAAAETSLEGMEPNFPEWLAEDPDFWRRAARSLDPARPLQRTYGSGQFRLRDRAFMERMAADRSFRREMVRNPSFMAELSGDRLFREELRMLRGRPQREHEPAELALASPISALARPLAPNAAVQANLTMLNATGIVMDSIWPRLELILPPAVRLDTAQREKIVAILRVATASAICTALAWPLALSLSQSNPSGVSLALLVVAPLLVALAILRQARSSVVDAYRQRSDVIDIYRFDLAKAMHLPVPDNSEDLVALGRILSADGPVPGRAVALLDPEPQSVTQPATLDLSAIREGLAGDISDYIVAAIRRLLSEQNDALSSRLTSPEISEDHLSLLAEQIAERTVDPVNHRLSESINTLREELDEQVRQSLRASVEESVLGPPLANFIGYLSIELDRRDGTQESARTADGIIMASAGRRINLVMSVVRDSRARDVASVLQTGPDTSFFVVEPVEVQGGRNSEVADFDAVVDSATLTPLPHRRNLRVSTEAQVIFGFQLPQQEGRHEVWFQLYQAGRLVQVTSITIESSTDPAKVTR